MSSPHKHAKSRRTNSMRKIAVGLWAIALIALILSILVPGSYMAFASWSARLVGLGAFVAGGLFWYRSDPVYDKARLRQKLNEDDQQDSPSGGAGS
ncbi:hypothetical protein [Cryobacterium sp. GrIS_2_6]|uniref:hypothetical protein n=1 Tax=Cryobacterium sp. GrIS_2_6 TaxID=3162785 RepID=UPI002E014F65|nr:hypothetical protein [Cryobacterium psychrotolerans]